MKKWEKPQLIVLVRAGTGEKVLSYCQGQDKFPQNRQLKIPQTKCSIRELALLLQLRQLGEHTRLAFLPQPVALASDVDGR